MGSFHGPLYGFYGSSLWGPPSASSLWSSLWFLWGPLYRVLPMGPPNMFFLWSSLWFLWGPPNRVLSMVLLLYGPPRGSPDGFFLSFSMVFGGFFLWALFMVAMGSSQWLLSMVSAGSSVRFLSVLLSMVSVGSCLWVLQWGPPNGSSLWFLWDPACIPFYVHLYGFCRILLVIPLCAPLYGFCGVLPVGPPLGSSQWVLPGIFSMILFAPSLWFHPGVSMVLLSPAHPL